VNVSDDINSSDVSLVKLRSGNGIIHPVCSNFIAPLADTDAIKLVKVSDCSQVTEFSSCSSQARLTKSVQPHRARKLTARLSA
jgi:hypothetical protein